MIYPIFLVSPLNLFLKHKEERLKNRSSFQFEYYEKLVDIYGDDKHKGEDYFVDLFETDKDGVITSITPIKSVPWAVLFFVQNLMINQRLSRIEKNIGVL